MEAVNAIFPASVILEDNHILVVAKPPGIAVQGDGTQADLISLARAYLKEKYQKSGQVFCSAAHRLDTNVSGPVILARTSKAAARLQQAFRERQVRKFYKALTMAPLEPGFLNDLVAKNERLKKTVADANGKEARLQIISSQALPASRIPMGLDRKAKIAALYLLEMELFTGRYHQVRFQLARRGASILGDVKYGSQIKASRLYLHCHRLLFRHPVRQTDLDIQNEPDWLLP